MVIFPEENENHNNYNKRHLLTQKSHDIILELNRVIAEYVSVADQNIPAEDRVVFYRVLGEFDRNIESMIQKPPKRKG